MSQAISKRSSRKPGVSPPWARKRKRVFMMFLVLLVLLSPALIWRLRLAREVNQLVATHHDQGRPLNSEELHGGADPISAEENGARDILAAVKGFQPFSQQQMAQLPFLPGQQPPVADGFADDQREAMASLVAANLDVLEHLHAGAEKPYIRYPEDYLVSDGVAPTPHVATLSALVVLLCSDAVLAAESEDTASAWRALHTALAVIRSLGSDESLDSLYRQWTLETPLLHAVQRALGETPPGTEALTDFATYFTRERRTAQWQRACDVELSVFIARMRHGEQRGLFQGLLLAAGVGDLNLKVAFALYEPMRAGYGLSWMAQIPYEKAYREVHADIRDHSLLYATVRRRHQPAYWDVMRQTWNEVVLAELAFAVEAYRARHGDYPVATWVQEKADKSDVSGAGELHYEAGPTSCKLEIRGKNDVVKSRWAVGRGANRNRGVE